MSIFSHFDENFFCKEVVNLDSPGILPPLLVGCAALLWPQDQQVRKNTSFNIGFALLRVLGLI